MKAIQKTELNLVNADLYRLLANCFDFPTKERLYAIREISVALSQAGYPDKEIQKLLTSLSESIDESEILNSYSTIFIKGGVPLNESHVMQKYDSVSDVSAFYNAFGFSPKSGENPDSIMYEMEFLALLSLKMTIAPNEEAAMVTKQAYIVFLKEHIAEFAVALAKRIREGNAGNYFIIVTHLVDAFINKELLKIK
jgi:TorA maturation chaperone TorD